MIERTLLVIKPDGIQRAMIGKVISRFEDVGFKVIALKMVLADKKLASEHYIADEKWFQDTGSKTIASYKERGVIIKETPKQVATKIRNYIIDYISSGPVVAMVLEGNDAISITRKIVGATEPRKADPSTIRGLYSSDSYEFADVKKRPTKNIVHASEDKKTAEREISVWFKPSELMKYTRPDENAMY